jgi:hypothetical protein
MSGRQTRRWLLVAAFLLVATGLQCAWAQFTGADKYNPYEYSKEPARWKAPPVPKPYAEDKVNRYYTLADFKPNDKNLKRFVMNLDEKKQPIVVDGKPARYALCYLERGDLENFVEYWLAGRFKTFECTLMVPEGFKGKMLYYVYGDDKKLLQGDDLGADRKTAHITLSVEGVRRLVLKTSSNASTENVCIVWANPVLTEAKDDE